MGRNKKDRAEDWGSDDGRKSVQSRQNNNKKGPRVAPVNEDIKSSITSDKNTNSIDDDRDIAETQTEVDFDPYFEVVDDFKGHLVAIHKALKKVDIFYSKQKHDIRSAVQNKEKLKDLTVKYRRLGSAVETLRELEREKDERLELQLAKAKEEREELEKAKSKVDEDLKKLEEDKESFKTRVKDYEAEQIVKLEAQQKELAEARDAKIAELEKAQSEKLAEAEKAQNEAHRERMETLERETKERQDHDEKVMSDYKLKHEKLQENFDEQQIKLKEVERKCRLAERLNDVSDEAMETLKKNLRHAENEFELNTHSTEYYQKEFLKIETASREISERSIKELHISDLDSVHEKLEALDESFASVPISGSEVSIKLCVAHMQRIIASHLKEVIWQPFSSDLTSEEQDQTLLLNHISDELAKSTHGNSSGPRAARLHAALTMRCFQSQSTSSTKRAEAFTEKVMSVISLLIEESRQETLRTELSELATSAASLWNSAQTDERELTVHPNIDPESCEGWHADIPAPNEVIVLFPRISARKYPCPWTVHKTSTGTVPGAYVESEPESNFEESCIHNGTGLPEWSDLAAEGEEEEEERKAERERQQVEEQRKEFEEKLKRRLSETIRHKRRISSGRRDSFAGSGQSSPSGMWMNGGAITEVVA